MITKDEIRRELSEVAEHIACARTTLSQDQLIDISGIPEKVRSLAGAIADLAPEDAAEMKPLLIELLDEFRVFSEDVKNKISQIQASTGSEARVAASGRSGT